MSDATPDFDRLQALLKALGPERDGMSIAELDGYIAALAVCLEPVPPPEWLPGVWGGDRAFAETAEAGALVAAVLDHYSRVARSLADCPEDYEPVMGRHSDNGEAPWGKAPWKSWIDGFERAMRLRPASWQEFVRSGDEEASASLGMMAALNAFRHAQPALTDMSAQALDRLVPEMIPNVVRGLNAWRRRRSSQAGQTGRPSPANKRRS